MSSIAITGGATGTGVFSLLAPSTSTNRTINLPDSNGTILTTIRLQNDSDGKGDYIAAWDHPTLARPTEEQLA